MLDLITKNIGNVSPGKLKVRSGLSLQYPILLFQPLHVVLTLATKASLMRLVIRVLFPTPSTEINEKGKENVRNGTRSSHRSVEGTVVSWVHAPE